MADSHGKPETIAKASDFLKKMGCGTIFHLGDICDSLRPETAGPCIEIIKANHIRAIKGNNDHILALNLKNGSDTGESFETMNYLNALPQNIECHNAMFTHSLPFEMELGASAMIGKMGTVEAERFFSARPETLLFRGHSHLPKIIFPETPVKKIEDAVAKNAVSAARSSAISPGQKIDLKNRRSCVITCGALMDGVCMIWRPEQSALSCHCFDGSLKRRLL